VRHELSLWLSIAALAVTLGVAACGGGAPVSEPEAVVQPPIDKGSAAWDLYLDRERPSGTGRYKISYTPIPDPIPRNEIFDLDLKIEPVLEGAPPPEDLTVRVRAEMPVHSHGMNTEPVVISRGGGEYRVEGMLFHMVGHWQIYVELTEGESRTEATLYDVVVE